MKIRLRPAYVMIAVAGACVMPRTAYAAQLRSECVFQLDTAVSANPIDAVRQYILKYGFQKAAVPKTSHLSAVDICRLGLLAHGPSSDKWATATLGLLQTVRAGGGDSEMQSAIRFATAALQNKLGHADSVLQAIAAARSADASAEPLLLYEQIRAMFVAGRSADAWSSLNQLAGAGVTDAITLWAYDTEGVMDSLQVVDLHSAAMSDVSAMLLNFWRTAAASSGAMPEELLTEHYRRLTHANSWYYARPRVRSDSIELITPGRYEPRWRIYIRYGKPDRIIGSSSAYSRYETWLYADANQSDGTMLFHLSGVNGRWSLIGPMCGEWLWQRAELESRLANLWNTCSDVKSPMRVAQTSRQLSHEIINEYRTVLKHEHYQPFKKEKPFTFALYQFRDNGGALEISAAAQFKSERDSQTVVTLVLADTSRGESAFAQKTVQPSSGSTVMTAVAQQAAFAPTMYRISARVVGTEIGRTYGGPFTTSLDPGRGFGISDIVVVRPGAAGPLTRAGRALQPILGATDLATLGVYYEVYGLTPNDTLQTAIALRKQGSSDDIMSISFKTIANADVALEYRDVTHHLDPGRYELVVTVRNSRTGQSLNRSTRVEIARSRR